MAFADTADLIIALNLRGNAERGLRGINAQIDNLTRNATVRGGLGQISQGIGVGLRNSAILGGVALAGLVTQVKFGVESLRELENANAQTAAALASTGGVSGQTLESIRALSEEYETLGGVLDDKIIQAGANVLLTFRRIDADLFEPALVGALDLSTALGTDLQTAVLQVGKALEDPIAGVTALRRAGVQFTEAQQDQIKAFIETNQLAEAQKLILEELAVQVGGRFAAAGTTNEATVGRMGDAYEELQKTLTRGFLPAIDKVAVRLTTIFADPAVIARVEEFGDRLAGFLNEENLDRAEDVIRGTFGYLATIPWGAIGDGLRIAGQGAAVAINAFKSLPPGVQNALITLLAANKLTGGLVATGLGQLAAVALGSLRTITAGHVTVVGPVTGTPVGPTNAGGGGFGRLLFGLTGVGLAAMLADEFEEEIEGFAGDLRASIVGEDFPGLPSGPSDWQWPFGSKNPPVWLPEFLGGPGPDMGGFRGGNAANGGGGSGSFTGPRAGASGFGVGALRDLIAGARTRAPMETTIRPLIGALDGVRRAIEGRDMTGDSFTRNVKDTAKLFVPTVKLDPSQVIDLRGPSAGWPILFRLADEAASADRANRTASNFLATEAIKNRMETSARLTTLASKYDSQVASLNGVNSRLDAANSKLAAISAKNFSPTIKVENKVSSTVITNNVVQNRTVAGGYVNLPSRY